MEDTKYNGWTNYATWRINLEMFDSYELNHISDDVSSVAEFIKEEAEGYIEEQANSLALSYALAFMSEVNWYEIAEHLIEAAKDGELV
jgi:hypothetical protein